MLRLRLIGHWLTYVAVRFVLLIVAVLPLSVCVGICNLAAWFCCDLLGIRRQVVDENLRHAFPEWTARKRRQVARGMWRHFFLVQCETIKALRVLQPDTWRKYIKFSDDDHQRLEKLLADGRGAIFLTCHFGNFEVGGMFGRLGYPPRYAIARPMDNPFLDRYFIRIRESVGQMMLPKLGISGDVVNFLQDGNIVGVLADQYGGPKGCWVDFFNRPASYHKSIALFALTAQVPIVLGSVRRAGKKPMQFVMELHGLFDPREPQWQDADIRTITQWYSDRCEKMIRKAPEQYWWLHRRWKDTRAQRQAKRNETRKAA